MALIHGSRGLIYFVHQFEPVFREAALLDDPEMLAAVTTINQQIRQLAPILNQPSVPTGALVESSAPDVPIACMLKKRESDLHLFCVNMREAATKGSFTLRDIAGTRSAEVLGENRTVPVIDGTFSDDFEPYAVHLYRLPRQ
jgi:hypothetical protein